MDTRNNLHRMFLATAFGLVVAASGVVVPPSAAEDAVPDNIIEEIVVTARKRAENAQDVPAAISAFRAEELEERGVDNIVEVARLTPNVTLNETSGLLGGSIQAYIRGIGNDPSFDQGVGIYVDDVYVNRIAGTLLDVYDVERIEVLKGPQGNLYGRNTTGGAIKYVSAEPDNETRAHIEGKIGTDELRKVRAGLSGALAEDRLFGSAAISWADQHGYQTNLFDGGKFASQDKLALRGTLVWEATDALRVKFVGDLFRDDSVPRVPTRVAANEAALAGFQALLSTANLFLPGAALLPPGATLDTSVPADKDEVNTAHTVNGYDRFGIDTDGFSLTAHWDLNPSWTLKSITALRLVDLTSPLDLDGSDQVFIDILQERESEDFSQELQLNYASDRLNGVFGLYYLKGDLSIETFTTQTPFLRLLTTHVKETYEDERDLRSFSVYANVDWDINDQWQLSVGGRYTEDEKNLHQLADVTLTQHVAAFLNLPGLEQAPLVLSQLGAQVFPMLPFFNFFLPHTDPQGNFIGLGNSETVTTFPENKFGEDEWSEFTPRATLSYRPNENTMLYAGASTGFKSGGFPTSGAELYPPAYEPETVITYTLGLKTTLLDGSMRINAEAFLNDYEEKQVDVITLIDGTLVQTYANVGKVESRGAEIELLWLPPLAGLTVNLNLGFLNVDVKELIDVLPGSLPRTLGDVSGDRALGYSPELNLQARVQYRAELDGAGSLTLGVDADYRDEMYTNSPVDLTSPFLVQSLADERTLVNAFVTWRSADERLRVKLEVKNLSDKRLLENSFHLSNFIVGGYNRGRTWGLTIGYDLN